MPYSQTSPTTDGAHSLAAQVRTVIGERLDILVANAGRYRAATIEETTDNEFDELFAVNVRAPFFLVQQLVPIMGNGSSIVLISSLATHAAFGTIAAYAATKGALDTLVKHFAFALGARGIRVNGVAPGLVERTEKICSKPTSAATELLACRHSSVSRNPRYRWRRRIPGIGRLPLDYRRYRQSRRRFNPVSLR